jgi:heptosyltransferase II
MKILVIQKKRIGDVLVSTIIFEALREKFPEAKLHYLIYPNSISVVENNPFIDKLVILDDETKKSKSKFLSFLFNIRKEKYNVVVDAYGKPNSVLIGWFSRAKIKITFSKIYSKILYSHNIIRNQESFSNATKAIEHRMMLLKPLGIDFKEIKPKIFLTKEEKDDAKQYLLENKLNFNAPILMISAVGSNENKTYPSKFMAKILDLIVETSNESQLLFNYLPFQKNIAQEIYDLCNQVTQNKIFFEVYENDLRKFLALTSHCNALIGNEGGATNMAKALNIPTFTIFSPIVPKFDWNMFENETTNISVHLNDYLETETNSDKFEPDFFEDKLKKFVNFNCK